MTGVCKLRGETAPLIKSHFIARGLIERIWVPGIDHPEPVSITPTRSVIGGRHMTANIMCKGCDALLAVNGENWVMEHCFDGTQFPLHERLKLALPVSSRAVDGATAFSGTNVGVDTDKLAYFALSIIWRAAIRSWTTSATETCEISLRAPIEPIRGYLAGELAFPSDVWVCATVCSDRHSQGVIIPPFEVNSSTPEGYSMFVAGFFFRVFFGTPPPHFQGMCCVHSPLKLIYLRDTSAIVNEALITVVRGSRRVGILKERIDNSLRKRFGDDAVA